jgi:hypothetical protein
MVKSSLSNDEALARALQNEYEQEYRSSQERPPPTAPPSNRSQGTNARMPTSTEKEDAAYARRLEREMRAQEASSFEVERSSTRSTQPTSRSSSRDEGNLTADEAYARRVEQEDEDERVARQLSSQEEQRASRERATAVAAASPRRGPVRRFCGFLIPMAVIGGIAAGIYYLFFSDGGANIPGFVPGSWADFAQEDPFNQTSPEQADRWRNNGNGLSLEVVNALEDKWYEFFYKAISDWDAGNPDVLSLTTSVRSPDRTGECASLDGKIKVCNFDYGRTNWRGRYSNALTDD